MFYVTKIIFKTLAISEKLYTKRSLQDCSGLPENQTYFEKFGEIHGKL